MYKKKYSKVESCLNRLIAYKFWSCICYYINWVMIFTALKAVHKKFVNYIYYQ